jgi:hypothetical protein
MKYLFMFLVLVGCASRPEEKIHSLAISPSEMQSIQSNSNLVITSDELADWDDKTQELIATHPLKDGDRHRVFAYLYQAQKAFADASNGKGTIAPISAMVLKLFFPHFKNHESSDPFSKELTQLLAKKIDARFRWEKSHIHSQKIPLFPNSWEGIQPSIGLRASSMQPWGMKSASEFLPPKPPAPEDPFWQNQLSEIKQQMKQMTQEQNKAIFFWDEEADWKKIANDYIKEMEALKQIEIRAALASAMLDAYISVFDAKYTYMVRRPNQLDPNLKTVITTPNHPSYPAAHSAIASAAAAVLSTYLPENQTEWDRLVQESGLSRIQAGVHFPIDVQTGNELGDEVAKNLINKLTTSSSDEQ